MSILSIIEFFSVDNMITIYDQLCHLPWIVAIQMVIASRLVDFKEANTLCQEFLQTIKDKKESMRRPQCKTLEIMNEADLLFSSEGEDTIEFARLLRACTCELVGQGILIHSGPTDGSLYNAFHVDVTPTML